MIQGLGSKCDSYIIYFIHNFAKYRLWYTDKIAQRKIPTDKICFFASYFDGSPLLLLDDKDILTTLRIIYYLCSTKH